MAGLTIWHAVAGSSSGASSSRTPLRPVKREAEELPPLRAVKREAEDLPQLPPLGELLG